MAFLQPDVSPALYSIADNVKNVLQKFHAIHVVGASLGIEGSANPR